MNEDAGQGVLITGVYGSGKSSVAAQIAYELEQRRQPFALLDLDYLGWGGVSFDDHAAGFPLMVRNLAAVAANYREVGVDRFVVAKFVRNLDQRRAINEAVGVPLRVVRLELSLADIEQRMARDVTSGRRDDLLAAAEQISAGAGVGVEDLVVANTRPVDAVARQVLTWLGWGV